MIPRWNQNISIWNRNIPIWSRNIPIWSRNTLVWGWTVPVWDEKNLSLDENVLTQNRNHLIESCNDRVWNENIPTSNRNALSFSYRFSPSSWNAFALDKNAWCFCLVHAINWAKKEQASKSGFRLRSTHRDRECWAQSKRGLILGHHCRTNTTIAHFTVGVCLCHSVACS